MLTVPLGNQVGLSPRLIRSMSFTRSDIPSEVSSTAAKTAFVGELDKASPGDFRRSP